jgi:hypothetical protein
MIAVLMASLLAFVSGCALFVVGAAAGAGAGGYASRPDQCRIGLPLILTPPK